MNFLFKLLKIRQGILDKLKSLAVPYPYLGCLVFWGRSLSEIKHVEVCDGEGDDEVMMCIGARKSLKKIVRTPLLAYRSGLKLLAIVDPFMQEQYKQEVI